MRISRGSALALTGAAIAAPALALGESLTKITIGGVPEDSITPALWARQSGLFRHYGLEVDIQPQRSGTAIAAAVSGGSYQIGKSSIMPMILAHARKVPFVVIAPGGLYDASVPTIGLMVKADSPIRTAADANGKTVAVSALNDLYAITTKAWVDKNGGDSSTLKLLEFPVTAVTEAVETGRIDIGGSTAPELDDALATGKVRLYARMMDAIALKSMYTVWFSTIEYANANPKIVRAFAEALRDAATYTNTHHQQTVDLLSKYTGATTETIARMRRVPVATTVDPKLIQPTIDVSAKYKVIPAGFDAREMITPTVLSG